MKNYNKTKVACYLGFITQAIVSCFVPLLFLKFHNDYNISLGNIALIPAVFFFTQILIDLFCAKYVDAIGYRKSAVIALVSAALGLFGLAFLPDILPSPFAGIIICVILYAVGGGLIEVLCNLIIQACPFENKEASLSLLHSFYCWGSVLAVVLSTVFFAFFGIENWRTLSCLWALVPALNIINFATCPIDLLVEEDKGMKPLELFMTPLFWISISLMICAGASELSMAQWASAYTESALGFTKTISDLAGPCMFAVAEGTCRTIFGKYSKKMDLMKFMFWSGVLCLICYILATIPKNSIIGLIGCIVCGFSVGIMWPGTISISAKKFPLGGTAMFGILAMAGDFGGSLGPSIVGKVAEIFNDNIRIGLITGTIFPLILMIAIVFLKNKKINNTNKKIAR